MGDFQAIKLAVVEVRSHRGNAKENNTMEGLPETSTTLPTTVGKHDQLLLPHLFPYHHSIAGYSDIGSTLLSGIVLTSLEDPDGIKQKFFWCTKL